jgi:hypothetical protein
MGFLDWLFGRGKKQEEPRPRTNPSTAGSAQVAAPAPDASVVINHEEQAKPEAPPAEGSSADTV